MPIDTRSERLYCLARLEFAVQWRKYGFNFVWLVQCLDGRVD